MTDMRYAMVAVLILLTGCVGDQQGRQEIHQEAPSLSTLPQAIPISAPAHDDSKQALAELRTEVQSSNNANQNSITGLGIQVSKVAEKMQAFGGDLAHVQSEIGLKFDNVMSAHADLSNDIKMKFIASVHTNAEAIANLSAKMDAVVQAQAQTQAGINQRMESMTENIKSGRDSTVKNIQFTSGMVDVIKDGNDTLYKTILAMCGVITTLFGMQSELSRRRAENRHKEAEERNRKLQDHLIAHHGLKPESPKVETPKGDARMSGKTTGPAISAAIMVFMLCAGLVVLPGCDKVSPTVINQLKASSDTASERAVNFNLVRPILASKSALPADVSAVELWADKHGAGLAADSKGLSDLYIALAARPYLEKRMVGEVRNLSATSAARAKDFRFISPLLTAKSGAPGDIERVNAWIPTHQAELDHEATLLQLAVGGLPKQ